ncbi:TetR/AcrR family transcriptional regulator [Paeniglutamicibacter cryotolerans]|uniref:AcrR family transcriptional regulator n=1 Tax=Paeniglutamicibacter cryotolerans TaxID=670079 RepID=A0A839QFQ6_9MICC|nr:TetR family transcriptional regulator C-terminal domain-containing protein [Paeniglutamicibacter cryotolerans]MBB2994730.1 AcrR family transcriptional regulator [Paeniglutamicibacter cryotolerans]
MERRGRPKANPELLEPILLAVVGLIARRGVGVISMRDVADASGVSVGRLQHHFGSRRNLMLRAQEWFLYSVIEEIGVMAAGADSPWDRLTRVCLRASAGADQERRAAIWIDLLAEAQRDTEVRSLVEAINDRWLEVLEGLVREGVASGEFRPALGARESAYMLVIFVDGLDVAELSGPPGEARREARLFTAARLLLGLEAEQGPLTAHEEIANISVLENQDGVTRAPRHSPRGLRP